MVINICRYVYADNKQIQLTKKLKDIFYNSHYNLTEVNIYIYIYIYIYIHIYKCITLLYIQINNWIKAANSKTIYIECYI